MLEYDPSPCYWPAPILAYAGLNGRSFTGDDTGQNRDSDLPGALVGASEADAQPVYDSPFAASKRSGRCISLGLGSTGSGKAIDLDTPLPVPAQSRFPRFGHADWRLADDGFAYECGMTFPVFATLIGRVIDSAPRPAARAAGTLLASRTAHGDPVRAWREATPPERERSVRVAWGMLDAALNGSGR